VLDVVNANPSERIGVSSRGEEFADLGDLHSCRDKRFEIGVAREPQLRERFHRSVDTVIVDEQCVAEYYAVGFEPFDDRPVDAT
jgi:hypothetical protein